MKKDRIRGFPWSQAGQEGKNLLFYRRLILSVLLIALCCSSPAGADFESASAAYRTKNYEQAFQEFSELAEAGDARAQAVLAIMYKYGESVPADLEQAYQWYLRAAVQGYPPALYNVGIMLADGIGVEADSAEALLWLRKAADAGYERATDKIAVVSGDRKLARRHDEPIAWSKSWNLRLPNEIRDSASYTTTTPGLDIRDTALPEFRVQVGAMSSLDGAERLWKVLYVNNSDLFQGLQPLFGESNSGGRTVFRLQLGPFARRNQAKAFCSHFQAQFTRNGCIVVNAE